ncbi:MAG TPA: peptidase M3, partial [Fervidobacterium sp.]|nr:peptidase M3 [Fervidobacterium sp.]
MKWDLSNIYASFDSDDFKNDLQRLESELALLLNWMDANFKDTSDAVEKIEYSVNKSNELSLIADRLYAYASLTLSANANDTVAAKYLDIIRSKFVAFSMVQAKFMKFLKEVNVDFDKVDSQIVRLHSFPLKEIKTLAKHMLSEKEERLISLMRLTGGNAWNDLYEKTTSNLLCDVEIHGDVKKLPLMRVRNMAYDKDKEVRKAAYDAELKACDSVAEVIAQSLNSI